MKFSIPLALLILAIGSTFGWRENRRAAAGRVDRDQLAARASALGISTDPAHPGKRVRVTKRARADDAGRDAAALRVSEDFIAFAREIEARQKSSEPMDDEFQKNALDLMDRLSSLDAGQLKILIGEFRAASGLGEDMRKGLLTFVISKLATDHPQAALAVYAEVSKDTKMDGMGQQVIGNALSEWAKTDPLSAAAWLKENGAKFPEISADEAKRNIISGTASENPAEAFRLLGELGMEKPEDAVRNIVTAASTPEQRAAALTGLREYLGTLDPKAADLQGTAALQSLGGAVAREGFDSATDWLKTAELTPAELMDFTKNLDSSIRADDTAQWIGWAGENLPPEAAAPRIREMISNWTIKDYRAAGEWLAAEPAGPVRDASVRGYAETVSRYEPETAAQWAMTLPAGKQRQETLANIYQNWPRKDDESRAAADAFAKEHGIK